MYGDIIIALFFFSSRRRHTRYWRDWSSDVCSSDLKQSFTIRRPSSLTRRCCVRVSPIAQYSPLLPPVGVWAVSQSQCGRSPDRKSTRLNSSHANISYAVFCLKKKKNHIFHSIITQRPSNRHM